MLLFFPDYYRIDCQPVRVNSERHTATDTLTKPATLPSATHLENIQKERTSAEVIPWIVVAILVVGLITLAIICVFLCKHIICRYGKRLAGTRNSCKMLNV